ncbi:MAG: PD-(D/E)XK nuclease-like domain-containing protein [Actinocrinis sp.]
MTRPVITAPGLYPDVDEDWYHADPVEGGSLSVSGAKLLLQAPAKFDYARHHPHQSTKAMDLGTTVHGLVLGKGADIAVCHYDNWTTKAARQARDDAAADGMIPMLARDWQQAKAIAGAVLKHPTTGGLFTEGDAEVSMFWRDAEFGIWLRGRADYMTFFTGPAIVDFKTTKDASPEGFAKSVYEYGYHRQDPHYREGWASVLGCDWQDIDFIFACVETEPPYLVAAYRVIPAHVELGREQNRIARERFRDCVKSGRWPGYSEEIEDLELPYWGARRIEKDINDWHE